MAMSMRQAGGKGSRGHGRRGRKHGLMSEINVTPFVDVMLVLLIIFMVAAPLLTVGVPITVSINDKGQVFLQETEVPVDEVVPKLQAIAKTGYDERIYVRGDKTADYGTVMRVMARISSAGFRNLGLVTLQEEGK